MLAGLSSTGESPCNSCAIRRASVNALLSAIALSRQMPGTSCNCSSDACDSALSEPNCLCSRSAASIAETPRVPVRNRIAINSDDFSASAPASTSRSRGRSLCGRSLIRMPALMRCVVAARAPPRNEIPIDLPAPQPR